MASKKFDPKQLRMLSPDADDWNQLVDSARFRNTENAISGVLLYPKIGISENRISTEIETWVYDTLPAISHGSLDISVRKRGDYWAIVYCVSGWYNHFDLNEEYD